MLALKGIDVRHSEGRLDLRGEIRQCKKRATPSGDASLRPPAIRLARRQSCFDISSSHEIARAIFSSAPTCQASRERTRHAARAAPLTNRGRAKVGCKFRDTAEPSARAGFDQRSKEPRQGRSRPLSYGRSFSRPVFVAQIHPARPEIFEVRTARNLQYGCPGAQTRGRRSWRAKSQIAGASSIMRYCRLTTVTRVPRRRSHSCSHTILRRLSSPAPTGRTDARG